jgi:hypothetical protein
MADRRPLPGESVALTKTQLKNIVTALKERSLDQVLVIRNETYAALKRLELERDVTKNWEGNPNGSNQFDMRSILDWVRRIQKDDLVAVDQLLIIDATACARGGS